MSSYGGTPITNTAGTILAAAVNPAADESTRRKGITFYNDGPQVCYVGVGAGTALAPVSARGTVLSGLTLPVGASYSPDQSTWDVWQGITASGTANISFVVEAGYGE